MQHQRWIPACAGMTRFISGNPFAAVAIPVAMFVAAHALFACLGGIDFAAAAPAPAHGGQMVGAGGLEANGTNNAIGEGLAAGLSVSQTIFFVADVTKFDSHAFNKESGD